MFQAAYALNHALSYAMELGSSWFRTPAVCAREEDEEEFGPLGLKIGKALGEGTYGAVSKCWMGDRELAMKKMNRDLDNNASEIQPWALNLRHENIIRVHGYLMDAEFTYIIMDLHEADLHRFINQHERCVEGNFL